jgi:anti-sigma B factor antagonist
MKRDRTAADIRLVAEDGAPDAVPDQARAPDEAGARPQAGLRKAHLALADSSARAQTLIPTGNLDRHSAPVLEAEIERLFYNGITSLVLDLRQLARVDSTGVAVLAFRCRLCRRHGHDLRLIPGSRLMRRAFEEAGLTDLLESPDDLGAASLAPGSARRDAPGAASGESSRGG